MSTQVMVMNKSDDWTDEREAMSLLADGRLSGAELDRALSLFAESASARAAWQQCHLIGDAMRSAELAAPADSAVFLSRLRVSLVQPQPDDGVADVARLARDGSGAVVIAPAANDGVFRWKFVAGFASLMAVAAVGWSLFSQAPVAGPASVQLASQGGVQRTTPEAAPRAPAQQPGNELVVVAGPQGNLIRDPRLQELLAAHKQFGGTSALQTPSGFLRNATFEAPAR